MRAARTTYWPPAITRSVPVRVDRLSISAPSVGDLGLRDTRELTMPEKHQRRFIIHVGVHKTGSTSLQAFLGSSRERLFALGISFYRGIYIADNHVELHASAMRADRTSPIKMSGALPAVDETFRKNVRENLREFVSSSESSSYVLSAEGLSYLRYMDEMDRLKSLLPEGNIHIVVYLRNPANFLNSYREEMKKHRLPIHIDKDSFAYVEDDSWLLDFDERIGNFRAAFGSDNVTVLDYDREMHDAGNVIPSFLRVLGVETQFSPQDWSLFRLNSRAPS
jgi:hypothetical protein